MTHKIMNDYITWCGLDLTSIWNQSDKDGKTFSSHFAKQDSIPSCDACMTAEADAQPHKLPSRLWLAAASKTTQTRIRH
jgi:hypothetical protein